MKILVVGNGGREHALAWKLQQSSLVTQVFVAPGNAGTELEPGISNIPIAVDNIQGLIDFAQQQHISLTVIGPEIPLVLGIVDQFQAVGLTIFGPNQQAAQLEGSKHFCKAFLKRHNIPTAEFAHFNMVVPAVTYAEQLASKTGWPIVIKADGLAAGKGVVIAEHLEQAKSTIINMLDREQFGHASAEIIIEAFLPGQEASFIVMTDGKTILPFASSQDHKARDNGDKGPNTGGMGAYSPAPLITPAIHNWVMKHIIEPTLSGLKKEGIHYQGFLYAGLMVAEDGTAKILEYNCRFGDPETQPILLRLQSDLAELCLAASTQQLHQHTIHFDPQPALGVVLASQGYPESYQQDLPITLPKQLLTHQKIFHAGTRYEQNQLLSCGGRVLCVTTKAKNLLQAQQQTYQLLEQINWPHGYYRTDIGYKAL